ncbi:MAG: AMP-binding protein [Clostridia bacterium]|nr:AMP-binding protein [Clostridia bacterium]
MESVRCTLRSCLQALAESQPDKKLLGDSACWLTARGCWASVSACAAALHAAGIQKGELAALQTKRSLTTALLVLALRAAGALVVLCDPRHAPRDALSACDTEIPVKTWITLGADGVFQMERDGQKRMLNLFALPGASPSDLPPEGDPEEDGFILFTSGSMGKSKAVVLSEYNLINNLKDSKPLGKYSEDDIALGALPMEHVFGLVLLAGAPYLRYAVYYPEKTAVPSLLKDIRQQKITRMNGVPTLYQAMAEQADPDDIVTLRAGFIGGSPVSPAQFAALEEKLGMTLISVYGMTECIGISCTSWQDPQALRAASVGKFYSMNEGHILLENGEEARVGEIGEICVTGPARMNGYYGRPMPREELLHTGDLGCLDADGVLRLCGRKKEIIIRNGLNLAPRRIEEALLSLPGVRTAIVVGLPDERLGEAPYAMVTGRKVEPEELLPLLNKNEIPLCICSVEELPLTASGKLNRQMIREVLMQWRKG